MLIRNLILGIQIELKKIEIIEALRRLNQTDFKVLIEFVLGTITLCAGRAILNIARQQEIGHGIYEKAAARNHVGIERRNQR